MPDISMCNGEGCPKRRECYRHRAVPTPHRQSYFMMAPMRPDGTYGYFKQIEPDDQLAVEEEGVYR